MKSATDEGAEVSRTCTQQHLSRCSQLTILPSTANQRPPPRELNLTTWYKVHRDMLKKKVFTLTYNAILSHMEVRYNMWLGVELHSRVDVSYPLKTTQEASDVALHHLLVCTT